MPRPRIENSTESASVLFTRAATGRSSDFSARSTAFPPHLCDSGQQIANRVPCRLFPARRNYSGGTAPDFHGIPYYRRLMVVPCQGPAADYRCLNTGPNTSSHKGCDGERPPSVQALTPDYDVLPSTPPPFHIDIQFFGPSKAAADQAKKIPDRSMRSTREVPFYSAESVRAHLCPRSQRSEHPAGLLTYGSFYSPRLPVSNFKTVASCGFRPRIQQRACLRFPRSSLLSSKEHLNAVFQMVT